MVCNIFIFQILIKSLSNYGQQYMGFDSACVDVGVRARGGAQACVEQCVHTAYAVVHVLQNRETKSREN